MYIFDTNAVYYFHSRNPDMDKVSKFLSESGGGFVPPITIIEMVSKSLQQPEQWEMISGGAQRILEAGADVMPNPEQHMYHLVTGEAIPRHEYEFWKDILNCIASAPSAEKLREGFVHEESSTIRKVNVEVIASFRSLYEIDYTGLMLQVVRELNPRYDEQVEKGIAAKIKKSEVEALDEFFNSAEWIKFTRIIVLERSGIEPEQLNEETKEVFCQTIDEKIRLFRMGYKWLLRKMLVDGARPTGKRKNDYNDLHHMIYLSDPNTVIVSSDNGVLTNVAGPEGHVISFDDFINRT